ncbi:hypothetical protein PQQ59_18470 [Paraburkholderia aspalathi]|uniref:DUF6896 domain-containing protein n=1 Tax=Paraburkholderia aspalathi TaxID=1324617 RepID=UPI001B0DDC62|nr:hypothetical protein [Paraburkholderia aspalathi]CAE6708321.1 hypothetical protein R75465_00764 [Paraburkholderia aspalathi]
MNKQLAELIRDYQAKVHEALVLMQRSGIRMPNSNLRWIEFDIPPQGLLDGDIAYVKHGTGCTVYLPDGEVDFDFGNLGEINGFDLWRLSLFASEKLSTYGFESQDALERCFETAVSEGHLVRSDDSLFYVANLTRALAVDIDSRLHGDNLPPRNLDIVLVLHSHYFQAAELMLENYDNLYRKWKKDNSLSHRKVVDLRIYMSSWLGFLAVTCEGFEDLGMHLLLRNSRPAAFEKLIPKSDAVGKMIKRHRNPLRELRNKTFHLREDPEAIRRFFAPDSKRLPWARELHDAFTDFFSAYRVQCEVHYAFNGRRGELRVTREPPRRHTMTG